MQTEKIELQINRVIMEDIIFNAVKNHGLKSYAVNKIRLGVEQYEFHLGNGEVKYLTNPSESLKRKLNIN